MEVVNLIDRTISTDVSNLPEDLRGLQMHRCIKRCKKKSKRSLKSAGGRCAFGFPRPPMRKTMILDPLPADYDSKKKEGLQRKRRGGLCFPESFAFRRYNVI
jgi:hypothetical protein